MSNIAIAAPSEDNQPKRGRGRPVGWRKDKSEENNKPNNTSNNLDTDYMVNTAKKNYWKFNNGIEVTDVAGLRDYINSSLEEGEFIPPFDAKVINSWYKKLDYKKYITVLNKIIDFTHQTVRIDSPVIKESSSVKKEETKEEKESVEDVKKEPIGFKEADKIMKDSVTKDDCVNDKLKEPISQTLSLNLQPLFDDFFNQVANNWMDKNLCASMQMLEDTFKKSLSLGVENLASAITTAFKFKTLLPIIKDDYWQRRMSEEASKLQDQMNKPVVPLVPQETATPQENKKEETKIDCNEGYDTGYISQRDFFNRTYLKKLNAQEVVDAISYFLEISPTLFTSNPAKLKGISIRDFNAEVFARLSTVDRVDEVPPAEFYDEEKSVLAGYDSETNTDDISRAFYGVFKTVKDVKDNKPLFIFCDRIAKDDDKVYVTFTPTDEAPVKRVKVNDRYVADLMSQSFTNESKRIVIAPQSDCYPFEEIVIPVDAEDEESDEGTLWFSGVTQSNGYMIEDLLFGDYAVSFNDKLQDTEEE